MRSPADPARARVGLLHGVATPAHEGEQVVVLLQAEAAFRRLVVVVLPRSRVELLEQLHLRSKAQEPQETLKGYEGSIRF